MPREGDGVYDPGSKTGGGVKGLPPGAQPKGVPSKSPTGRPGVGGNPLGKNPGVAARKGGDDVKRNG